VNILITGANGFVGKNLAAQLETRDGLTLFKFDIDTDPSLLDEYAKTCDFVFHLAGVNRPENQADFMTGNFGFTSTLLDLLKKYHNKAPVLITSSIQAALDNPYGKSKKAGEDLMFEYGKINDVDVYVYRLANLFGKWSKPNYNTVVATFCYNIARDKKITVNNTAAKLKLCYIDDVLDEMANALDGNPTKQGKFCGVSTEHETTLGWLADTLESFKLTRSDLSVPDMSDALTKKLYSTYLSFLKPDDFSYDLNMNVDARGSFTEILRTQASGQVSVNISKKGITKGNHWHHSKNEKFLVVSGKGVIRFRMIGSDDIIEYFVSGDKLQVVDIPTGYTHNIENLGDNDMVTLMWVNECFDKDNPDTYYLEV
jgi:UDP-2-acetamido-2,6-beta-L-arabino-hexul-4-ose reductase